MSKNKVILKKYLLSRIEDSYILLQRHPENGKEICVIKKKGGGIDPQFIEAVQKQASAEIRFSGSSSCIRLEAGKEDQFSFLLRC